GDTAVITFTLSEASSNFTAADVVVVGGVLSNFQGSGTSYTATFTPDPNSTADSGIYVASGTFTDASGNANTDGAQANNLLTMPTNTTGVDTVAPTIAISSDKASLSTGQSATITFTLSEASTDFTAADVTVSGGTLSQFQGSGSSYSVSFTPDANSTANSVVSVASLKFRDTAGNFNTDGAQSNNTVTMPTNTTLPDTTPPSIAISSNKAQLLAGDTAVITFTLSEASSNFTAADVVVVGGVLSNFQGSGASYTATFTP
ncbi:MAG: Leukotoxin, partial [Comamonadaceae bacterium PBBC2]